MDIEALFNHIERALATRPFYPCVLLVHTDSHHLQRTADQLAGRSGWPHVAVSRALADALTEVAPLRRSLVASVALDHHLAQHRPGPVLCVDLALLFEHALSLNPLALLRQLCWEKQGDENMGYVGKKQGDENMGYVGKKQGEVPLRPT